MSSQLTVKTTQNVDLHYQIAPLGERILAFLIDGLIRVAYMIFLSLTVTIVVDIVAPANIMFGVIFVVLGLLPFILYHLLFEIFMDGQSPGKRVFRLKVVSIHGDTVSIGAYLLRWLFRIVDFQILSGLIALIAVASSNKGQRVGDMVAGTTVIKTTGPVTFRQLAYEETAPEYVPVYPAARRLSPRHIELIKETLDNVELGVTSPHVVLLADKIANELDIAYNEHPRKFLRTVLKDYSGG